MTKGRRHRTGDEPQRTCLVTGEVHAKSAMIRFVTGPDGQVVPDILNKFPARGYYITAQRAILNKAAKNKSIFNRGAKRSVYTPVDLVQTIEKQLGLRVIHLISLCRKSGCAVAGFEKVKSALTGQDVKVLFQASDGSERGKGKLWTPQGAKWFGCLTANELGFAFGRENVIHSALLSSGLIRSVIEDTSKLKDVRDNHSDKSAEKGNRLHDK